MSETEQREVTALQEEQHQTELNDLNYRLKLEQDEEAEKLRKVGTGEGGKAILF